LWLEAFRLEAPEKQRSLLAKAVTYIKKSFKIWHAAASIETTKHVKSKVLRRAIEHMPGEARLWKELIELEDEEEAKSLLHKAVECVPGNLEMWLALAKLETYENARSVLNKARKALPTEPAIWVNAAKLEESMGRDTLTI